MSAALLIATSFSIGFFVESIIGFGGGLIAYSILAFFMDLKTMILSGIYIGTLSSAYVAYTGIKFFDAKIFISIIPICVVGTIFGVLAFSHFSGDILSIIFGTLLIALAIKTAFFDNYVFPKIFKTKLLFIGGLSQGTFGIGGPFLVNALKNDFSNKSAMRTTMALFFVAFNIVRICQLSLQGELKPELFYSIWWAIIPVFFAIQLGYQIHLKISESFFKKLIAIMTVFSGLKFISKIFF